LRTGYAPHQRPPQPAGPVPARARAASMAAFNCKAVGFAWRRILMNIDNLVNIADQVAPCAIHLRPPVSLQVNRLAAQLLTDFAACPGGLPLLSVFPLTVFARTTDRIVGVCDRHLRRGFAQRTSHDAHIIRSLSGPAWSAILAYLVGLSVTAAPHVTDLSQLPCTPATH